MKFRLVFFCCSISFLLASGQQKVPIRLFSAHDVTLLDGVFKRAQQTDMDYLLALNADRLLAPYLREAGLPPKADPYPNWEGSGLDGHIGGHYLSALALMYASTGDPRVLQRFNYMLAELKRCQDHRGNGYIGGVPGSDTLWAEVSGGKIEAGTFSLNDKWVPLYNIHKIFAGLRDAFRYTGNSLAKEMLVKYSNWFLWLTAKLSDKQIQKMLKSEHGGINEVLADVYEITGDQKYLKLAYRFSDQELLQPLSRREDRLNGIHANTQIPKVIGFKRIADLNQDSVYGNAASFFWDEVVGKRSVANGGNSVREHFNPIGDFSGMISSVEGPETCNSYNMLKLTEQFYQAEGATRYLDYYERTLYNHILSSQHPGKGGFVYFTPMRPGHYRVYSQPETSFWCCVGSGLESHAKYHELIYAYDKDQLFLNLFVPSRLNWKEKGMMFEQRTDFPDEDKTLFKVISGQRTAFTLHVRYPSWVAPGALRIRVNGRNIPVGNQSGGYVAISRQWMKGDLVELTLPMHTRKEKMPDGSNYVAVLHGPILLAARTDTSEMKGLFADDSRMGHIASGKLVPLQEMPLFVDNQKPLAAQIKKIPGQGLSFSTASIIYPEKYKSLKLEPFYKIHDSRYIVYWQVETESELDSLKSKLADQQRVTDSLSKITIDMVYPGEQQPESDHSFKGEDTESGVYQDRHWRTARKWFSYELSDPGDEAKFLRLTYYGSDRDRRFSIYVNGQLIAHVALDGTMGEKFYSVDYPLPDSVKDSSNKLNVKFVAKEGFVTAGIYELRLIRKN
ncbi:glycoside hydrolase family 127 protein [Pedobacter sp. JY14-1]|uniref:glycoside hydrolase family 127 protein n=1 Tax=Pedobacter sp. JY14-1 TaxID=3034151 RepID=UPI0023E0D348|nr:glycoside hydrolase family 127 protein [Pedobacter sp. JY14-1]